jgi:hypothetical protein
LSIMEDDQKAPDSVRIERVVAQADKMVASGRLTVEEAEGLKTASDGTDEETVLRDIRARHAGERLDVAVAEGNLTREEADDILRRLRGGEHSRTLRSHLARFRPRRRPKGTTAPPSSDHESGQDRPA